MLLRPAVTKLLTEQGADVNALKDSSTTTPTATATAIIVSFLVPLPFTPHPRMDIPLSSAPSMARAQVEPTSTADLLRDLLANQDRDLRERNRGDEVYVISFTLPGTYQYPLADLASVKSHASTGNVQGWAAIRTLDPPPSIFPNALDRVRSRSGSGNVPAFEEDVPAEGCNHNSQPTSMSFVGLDHAHHFNQLVHRFVQAN
ncbi:hypothetical protein PILCRDRAFT_3146 [Piloderma croceum F 1598]|uniref:Uncharacterized protein n=1 Tax=Piloderma croceum (strain F 1598) TaxID=765440 RepID=A0A0C3GBU4_PILCF|nr:hypothetical protein PILCRDRAFT_3146 [Piloderma croceum F 1598]